MHEVVLASQVILSNVNHNRCLKEAADLGTQLMQRRPNIWLKLVFSYTFRDQVTLIIKWHQRNSFQLKHQWEGDEAGLDKAMIYDESVFSRGILRLFYIYYYVIHLPCISVSRLNSEKQQRQTYIAWSKKKGHTNILLDCVSFDDSTHPLFHYFQKLMQCYNTYFHLDLHFFTKILH